MQLNTLNSHNNIAVVTYDSRGRRSPLTGRLLHRWIGKCAHALHDYGDHLGPSSNGAARILIDMPPHWRSLVWALGAWWIGDRTYFNPTPGADIDIHLSSNLDRFDHSLAEVKVAQSLEPLAICWPEQLPWDIDDGIQVANQQPDSTPTPAQCPREKLFTQTQNDIFGANQELLSTITANSLICVETGEDDWEQNESLAIIAALAWRVFETDEDLPLIPVLLIPRDTARETKDRLIQQEAMDRNIIRPKSLDAQNPE